MALDKRYIADSSLQQYLVDKDTGAPLAGGKVYFFRDSARTVYKDVYQLTGNPPNYSFSPLPNPVILSAVGTIQDNNGNDVIPYYFPFLSLDDDTQDLYFVRVESSGAVPQFTREAWPPAAEEEVGPADDISEVNYIPNGQFLLHNNQPENGLLGSGTTILSPGGWTFELPTPVLSTNFITFAPINVWTENPPNSPPYEANVRCTIPNSGEQIKSLRIKFGDANKFALTDQVFTFSFSGRSNTSDLNVTLTLVKYFGAGGTPFVPVNIETFTLTAEQTTFSATFEFGGNSGYAFGAGETYVALDIAFPPSLTFDASFTDFLLVAGNVLIDSYPVQTDADTITRSCAGFLDKPDYDGMDLYLPIINTAYGQTYDIGQIGKIEAVVGNVTSPSSTSPLPITNDMPCDGAVYINSERSSLGIPYKRLGDYLRAQSPVAGVPLYGTGTDYVTAYQSEGAPDTILLAYNTFGAGSTAATDGNTTWSMGSIVRYGASDTGNAISLWTAFTYSPLSNLNSLFIIDNVIAIVNSYNAPGVVNTTPFAFAYNVDSAGNNGGWGTTDPDAPNTNGWYHDSVTAYQYNNYTLGLTAGSTLGNGAGPGKNWSFQATGGNLNYIWFYTGTESDPGGGGTSIRISIKTAYSGKDIAICVKYAHQFYQLSQITVNANPAPGSYWLFYSNPSALKTFYVWYSIDGSGVDPNVSGATGIEVELTTGDSFSVIAQKTVLAINRYQYTAPNFRGMFLRGLGSQNDPDYLFRHSSTAGITQLIGTYEFYQLQTHGHLTLRSQSGSGSYVGIGNENNITNYHIASSGGAETRPINAGVNYVIKY